MRSLFKNKMNQSLTSSAEVADGYLVLSLLDAQDPKIWRMGLDKIGTASFEIKREKDSETTKLILKPKKGTAEIIASFDTNLGARHALTCTSQALQNKPQARKTISNNVRQETTSNDVQENSNHSNWLYLLIATALVIGLYIYLTSLIPKTTVGFDTFETQQTPTNTENQTGVPMSADDFLSGS